MGIKLGELLVEQGALTIEQRDEILSLQHESHRPFGVIAEDRFGVSPGDIEQAWAVQYAMIARRVDPLANEIHPKTRSMITNRQAWQFGLIPLRQSDEEIEFATSIEFLARALRFVGWRIPSLCTFGICDLDTLKRGLAMHYPIAQMDPGLMDQLITRKPAA